MVIKEWIQETTFKFEKAGIASARLDTLVLLEHVLGTPRVTLLSHPETDLPATTLVRLNAARAERLAGIPVAYIQNKKEFYGRDFIVSEQVLIPRPETESIIEIAKSLKLESPKILDVGTGSGCIAITLSLEIPSSNITASDVSDEALIIARQNAKVLGAQVVFKKADLLKNIGTRYFDIICANLPYVPEGLITSKEITKEPALALFSGADGLDIYSRFFIQVADSTNKPLYIITESLAAQHRGLKKLAAHAGYQLIKTDGLVQLFGYKTT